MARLEMLGAQGGGGCDSCVLRVMGATNGCFFKRSEAVSAVLFEPAAPQRSFMVLQRIWQEKYIVSLGRIVILYFLLVSATLFYNSDQRFQEQLDDQLSHVQSDPSVLHDRKYTRMFWMKN